MSSRERAVTDLASRAVSALVSEHYVTISVKHVITIFNSLVVYIVVSKICNDVDSNDAYIMVKSKCFHDYFRWRIKVILMTYRWFVYKTS